MENKQVEENPGSSKSDLIIITPGECKELGLFQNIHDIRGIPKNTEEPETNECTEESIASLKQKIKNSIEACVVESRNVQSSGSPIKQQKHAKPIFINSKIGAVDDPLCSTSLGKRSTAAEVEVAHNKNKTINERKAPPCGTRKRCTLTSKVLNSGLEVPASISNKRRQPVVLNSAISKRTQARRKSKRNIVQETSNKTKPLILNSSVIPSNMGLTKSNNRESSKSKVSELNKSKPKILNSQVIKLVDINNDVISTKNTSEFKNPITNEVLNKDTSNINKSSNNQMKLETYKKREPSACTVVKGQKCTNPIIEIGDESEEDVTTAKTTKNLEDQNSCTEIINSQVIKKEVNIINDTPVRFSIEELKDLVCKARNLPKKCRETLFTHDSFTTEVCSQLDLAQSNHNEDVIIKNIEGVHTDILKREEITNVANQMKIEKLDSSKETIAFSEDKIEIVSDVGVGLQCTENKESQSSNSLLTSTAKALRYPPENVNKQRESRIEENQPREEKKILWENAKDVNDELMTTVLQKHEHNIFGVLQEDDAVKKHSDKLATNLTTTHSVKGNKEKIKKGLIKFETQNKEETKIRKQKTGLNYEQISDVINQKKIGKDDGDIANINDLTTTENKQSQSDGKHNKLSINTKHVLDPETNTLEQKEGKGEEIQFNNSGNKEETMTNENHTASNEQHMVHTEKNYERISGKDDKNSGASLAVESKDFGPKEGEEVKMSHNIKAHQSKTLHKLPAAEGIVTNTPQIALEATGNIKEIKNRPEVDKAKEVNSCLVDPLKAKDKGVFVDQAGIEHNQDMKSGDSETVEKINMEVQEPPASEINPAPKKRGRKKKMVAQDHKSTVKQVSEEEGYKKESVGILKDCVKEEEIKIDDKPDTPHSQLRNSSDMNVLEQVVDGSNEHSSKLEESRIATLENSEVETEDEYSLPTALTSVPKRRGGERKTTVEESKTFKDSNLDESDNDVEKNIANFAKRYTTNFDGKNGTSNLDHPHPMSPRDDLSTIITLKGDSNSTFLSQVPLKNRSDDTAILECKTPSSSTDANLPKKRGRPRKKTNLVETQEDDVSVGPTELNKEEIITSTPIPKKRGRKRKSEVPSVPAETTEAVQTTIESPTFEESFGKRKRKKINYFEMENNMTILDDFDTKPKRRKMLPKSIPELNPKKLKTYSLNKAQVSISDVTNVEGNSSNKSDIKDIQEESDTTKKSAVRLNEENRSGATPEVDSPNDVKQDSSSIQDNEANVSGKDTTEKKPKYRRTGETVLMMQSIFSAAVKNSSIIDSAAEESSSGNTSSEFKSLDVTSTKRGRGRMKKSDEAKLIVIDEDNMVTCMGCTKKIDNSEWDIHNRKMHYNLAWREGEQQLNLDDPSFITQKLKPILRQDKALICNKCERKDTSVKQYIAHMEVCSGVVSSTGLVTCAICKQEMEKSKWSFHKQRQHNNLAWRVGDRPLDLNNQNLVISILNGLYKAKKPLYCEKCDIQKKSVVGFLSHRAQCGAQVNDAKITCKFCDRKVLPVSMQAHIKLVHEAPKRRDDVGETSDYFDVVVNAASTKRQAAKTAMLIIDKFSKQKIVQDHTQHYVTQLDFEDAFVAFILKKELAEHQMIKCKFKNCAFETGEVKTLLDHMNSCESKPDQYYTCKKCLSTCDSESAIEEHVKTIHNIDLTEDDYKADCDEEIPEEDHEIELHNREIRRRMYIEKKRFEKDVTYKIKPACTFEFVKMPGRLFSHAFSLTSEFCLEHFSKPLLFNHLRYTKKEWELLDDELLEEYLPKYGQSCEVARKISRSFKNILGNEYTLKQFELFEVECDEGVTIFCGGPINAMAWLPTPYSSSNSNQILAIATANGFDEKYVVNENYSIPSVIQFWDFGCLQNKAKICEPKLMFGLAFDFGPVCHLEWCPSGCFDDEVSQNEEAMSRMGILAIAGSDSVVYIYSIPFLEEEQMDVFYKVKPLLKLRLMLKNEGLLGNQKFYATKISWSKALGHRYMAVGYTNGMVGLFDLETTSILLKWKDNANVDVFLPYRAFQAHMHYITVLHLVHLCGGNRWLLTASFDKDTFVWDLSNGTKISSAKKHIITDGVWLTNWIAYVTTADESSTKYGQVHACIKSYRDYMYEHINLTTSPTTIMCLSWSDWLNSIIQGSSVGDICAIFPNQMVNSVDSERSSKSTKYFLGCAKLIDKQKTPAERVAEEIERQEALKPDFKKGDNSDVESTNNPIYNRYEPITYQEAEQKYGLLFCDRKMDSFDDLYEGGQIKGDASKCEEMEYSRPNLYPLQTLNKIVYNPNRQASLYYATGYQAGFVRLTYLKFLENDPQIV